jgi:hypothetical protein
MKYSCPYCESVFLQFIESEEQLREHIMQAHGRELSFIRKPIGQMPERAEEQNAKTG